MKPGVHAIKPPIKLSAFFLSIVFVFFISCKKERSGENWQANQAPIANAGTDQVITLPKDSITLDGSASTDPDGTLTSYKWTKISGPVSANIIEFISLQTLVTTLVTGAYRFELTVTDNGGLSAKDTVQIIVNESTTNQTSNQSLKANAGPDQTITLPLDSAYLDGSSSSPNGWQTSNAATYVWTKISGPSEGSLSAVTLLTQGYNPTTKIVRELVPGTYLFRLQVTNSLGISDADTVQIDVVNNPVDKNTITFHNLIWEGRDNYGLGSIDIFLTTSIRPDIFFISGSSLTDLKNKPIEVQLKLGASSPWIFVPYRGNSLYTYDQFPWLLWITCYPNNSLLVGTKSSIKIKLL